MDIKNIELDSKLLWIKACFKEILPEYVKVKEKIEQLDMFVDLDTLYGEFAKLSEDKEEIENILNTEIQTLEQANEVSKLTSTFAKNVSYLKGEINKRYNTRNVKSIEEENEPNQ